MNVQTEVLASWADGAARRAIVEFVERTVSVGVPVEEPCLRLLVVHDDGQREFDYTSGAEHALEQADTRGWTVVSIKNDWSTVF